MKKTLLLLLSFLLFNIFCVNSNSQSIEHLLGFEYLTYEQVYSKFQDLQIQNAKIKQTLYEHAPDYVYKKYIAEQSQWVQERDIALQNAFLSKDKNSLCNIVYMEYLRVGTLLNKYAEYLPIN
jgi:hypothetical protein